MPKRTLKLTPKKKPVREGAMQVQMTPQAGAAGGAAGQHTIDVDASDPAAAVQQAQQQVPGKKFSQVAVATKSAASISPPSTNQPGTSRSAYATTAASPSSGGGTQLTPESTALTRLSYPYGIIVPKQF